MNSVLLENPHTATPAPAARACRHCGAPLVDERMRTSGFCCAGCGYVFRLVHELGLDGYYRIKDEVTAPADAAVFQPRDYKWLETMQQAAEAATERSPELSLDVQGISCAGCVWLIEHVFHQQAGARDINVNAQYGTLRLRWLRDGKFSARDLAHRLQALGYLVGPPGEATTEPESRGLIRRIGLCAAFAMNVMLFSLPVYFGMDRSFEWAGLFGILSLAFGTLSLLVGGTYFLIRALAALRERTLHIDLPISLGILGAYTGSLYGWIAGEEQFIYFDFVSSFILLMLIGRWAQVAAVDRNRRRLLRHQPKPPRIRLQSGAELPPEQLQTGQSIFLDSGQTLPVESRLSSPAAQFSLASINGESAARTYKTGQRIPAGALYVGRDSISLETLQGWNESLLAKLLAPVDRQDERHVLLERIVRGYLIGILVTAGVAGTVWWLASHDALRTGAVVTAVLVVSCPCAIALAFPLADEMAVVALRKRGVFVREGSLWPKLARVDKIVFDKTGTLTLEAPILTNPESITGLAEEARAALSALVRDNSHPISQCLLENLLANGPVEPLGGDVCETVGYGVELGPWSLGRAGWRNQSDGIGTVLAHHGQAVAHFHFQDAVRPDAREEIRALQGAGKTACILSGDEAGKVRALADELGLPGHHAMGELSPEEKAEWIHDHGPDDVMMLGDGANDSLAFDRALCRGTPVIHRGVLEQKADFYYLGRGISGIRALFEVDQIRRRTQRFILIFSVIYNLLAVGLAVAGAMNPLLAAALMPINSLLTLLLVSGGMRPAFTPSKPPSRM